MKTNKQLTNSKQYKAIKQAYVAYKQEQEDIAWSKLALAQAGLTVEQVIQERTAKTYNKTAEYISLAAVVAMFVITFALYL